MKKVLFFSGTHGCGKTTTINRIKDSLGFEIFSASDGDHGNPYVEPYYRQVWRLNKYYLDALNIFEQQKNKFLLADRCVFDHEAYTRTFHILGWLSDEQFDKIEKLRKVYFTDNFLPQNVVLFFPEEDWTIDRIRNRWNEEKKKWNEGDFNYLRVLREQYYKIYKRERNILLVKETDLNLRVKQIKEWLK